MVYYVPLFSCILYCIILDYSILYYMMDWGLGSSAPDGEEAAATADGPPTARNRDSPSMPNKNFAKISQALRQTQGVQKIVLLTVLTDIVSDTVNMPKPRRGRRPEQVGFRIFCVSGFGFVVIPVPASQGNVGAPGRVLHPKPSR